LSLSQVRKSGNRRGTFQPLKTFEDGDKDPQVERRERCEENATFEHDPAMERIRRLPETQSRQSSKLFSSRRNWVSPTPLASGKCALPPFGRGGEHTRLRERGWGSPKADGGTFTVVLYIYKYCAQKPSAFRVQP
jgi:hypothetical protein